MDVWHKYTYACTRQSFSLTCFLALSEPLFLPRCNTADPSVTELQSHAVIPLSYPVSTLVEENWIISWFPLV